MNARLAALAGLLLFAVPPASAHRLDEYLQATFLSVETDLLKADMYLNPGVAVWPTVLAELDRDRNGVISEPEQRAYAERVLADLSLTLNSERLALRLVAVEFPPLADLREGRGDIHLEFSAPLPRKTSDRKFRLENHHHSRISSYQVSCLVPRDPAIRIGAEQRNFSQSVYELDYMVCAANNPSWRFAHSVDF